MTQEQKIAEAQGTEQLLAQGKRPPESGRDWENVVVTAEELMEHPRSPGMLSCARVRKDMNHISMQEKTEILNEIDACLAPFCAEDAAQMVHAYLSLRGIFLESFKLRLVP